MPSAFSCGLLIFGSGKEDAMGFWSSLFGGGTPEEKVARAASKAELRAKREAEDIAEKAARANELFERALGNDPDNCSNDARRKAAIKLVLANETAKGREAWLSISRDYPAELADALEQVGVCYHLDKDYRSALENYEAAIRVGADVGHLADNIEEARKGMAAFG
jgi:tetratricopeptide (TPR) repeat protein